MINKRWLVLAGVTVPIVALLALLVWGLVLSGGQPGNVVVNSQFGKVNIKQRSARPFQIELFNGKTLALEDLKGKVVMVDFWASWCPPCRREAPILAQVYKEYEGKDVEFVGVDIWDTEDAAKNYILRYGITYPSGLDPRGEIAIDYGVTGIPEKYFINRDGIVVRKFIGPTSREVLKQVLDELLAQ